MLVVGVDSYVTLEEANKYVQDYFANDAAITSKWTALTDAAKESLLRQSTQAIDNLFKFKGRKKKLSQPLQFPRIIYSGLNGLPVFPEYKANPFFDNSLMDSDYYNDGGLTLASRAVVENSVAAMNVVKPVHDAGVNAILGITSKKIGPIAETYGNAQGYEARAAKAGVYVYEKVAHILMPYIDGPAMSI